MMRPDMGKRFAIVTGLLLVAAGLFFAASPTPVLAKSACLCSCRSDEVIVTKQPAGTSAAACADTMCPAADVCGGAANVAGSSYANGRCSCQCRTANVTAEFAALSAGQLGCRADCSQTCGGAANLQGDGRVVDVSCVPGSADCRTGAFLKYEGVSCVLQTATDPQNWTETNGMKPSCVIPVTARNANIECQQFGGIAKGGSCGRIETGQNPDTFFKSRPKIGGGPGLVEYTGSYTQPAWNAALDGERPNNRVDANDGICYRYGITYGTAPLYDSDEPVSGGLNGSPTNKNVCLKLKTNTCGTKAPPLGQRPTAAARSYSCQREADVILPSGSSLNDVCFPLNDPDACVASAGTRCCQGGTVFGGCLTNADCSADYSRICQAGTCVVNTQCDPDPAHNEVIPAGAAQPWLYDSRRCRSASEVEKANPSICSSAPTLSSSPWRCPNTSQSCCRPANPAVTGGCASDYVYAPGVGNTFNNFTCIPTAEIPATQYITLPDGTRSMITIESSISGFNNNPAAYGANSTARCLGSSAPKIENGVVVGSVPRCGSGRVCCDAPRLVTAGGATTYSADLAGQRSVGQACGTGANRTCRADVMPATDAEAQTRFFANREAYLSALLQYPGCQFTPFDSGSTGSGANKECRSGATPTICCDVRVPAFRSATACTTNADCTGAGQVCDGLLHACVDQGLVGPRVQSESCLVRASAVPDAGGAAVQISNLNPGTDQGLYSCQLIALEAGDVSTKCLPAGLGCDIAQSRCCIPGVGLPASAAATRASTSSTTDAAPFSLKLPACIQTGGCGLDDIVTTGANFANFLIQISGAIFLVIFVYGGFLYLTAGTSAEYVTKGKNAIRTAVIAMLLIMSAYVLINFVKSAILSGTRGGGVSEEACVKSDTTRNMSCQLLPVSPTDAKALSEAISQRGCIRNKCPGAANYVCCPGN